MWLQTKYSVDFQSKILKEVSNEQYESGSNRVY